MRRRSSGMNGLRETLGCSSFRFSIDAGVSEGDHQSSCFRGRKRHESGNWSVQVELVI